MPLDSVVYERGQSPEAANLTYAPELLELVAPSPRIQTVELEGLLLYADELREPFLVNWTDSVPTGWDADTPNITLGLEYHQPRATHLETG